MIRDCIRFYGHAGTSVFKDADEDLTKAIQLSREAQQRGMQQGRQRDDHAAHSELQEELRVRPTSYAFANRGDLTFIPLVAAQRAEPERKGQGGLLSAPLTWDVAEPARTHLLPVYNVVCVCNQIE